MTMAVSAVVGCFDYVVYYVVAIFKTIGYVVWGSKCKPEPHKQNAHHNALDACFWTCIKPFESLSFIKYMLSLLVGRTNINSTKLTTSLPGAVVLHTWRWWGVLWLKNAQDANGRTGVLNFTSFHLSTNVLLGTQIMPQSSQPYPPLVYTRVWA